VTGPFDDEPEDIESQHIEQVIPQDAADLWNVTISRSTVWNSDYYSSDDRMDLADMFADAVVSGDFDIAEEFLFYIQVDWDEYDEREFWEAYETLKNG